MSDFPFLTVIVFTPIVTGLLIFLVPGERKNLIRWMALIAATIALGLSVWVYFGYDQAEGGYQFIEQRVRLIDQAPINAPTVDRCI